MKSLLNMRPFQLILLIIFAFFALLGLFLFANYNATTNGGKGIGTVVIWGTVPQAAVQTELDAIEQNNKAYSKVTYVQEPAATFDSDLANAIAAEQGPDLILINQEDLLTEQDRISMIPFSSALPQRAWTDTYLPEDSLYLTTGGTYGVPYVLDPLVLYYNQSLLTSANVAVPPATWEALTGLTPQLTKLGTAQSVAQSTIPFGTYDNVENARAILSLLFLQAGSPISQMTSNGPQVALVTQPSQTTGVPPAESALNFYTQFADPTRTTYSWNETFPSAREAFLAGNTAFYVGFASELPELKAANPNLDFNMAQIPFPQTSTQKVDYGLAYAFAIPKTSANPGGALAAALALANKQYLQSAATELSMAPAQRQLLSVSPTDPYAPVYYPLALISQGWLSPAPAATDQVFSAMISNVNSGRLSAESAVDTASQALQAALQSP